MKKTYAVLTGDVVGSRRLSSGDMKTLFHRVRELWTAFDEAHSGAVVGNLEVFRGDGWQGALAKPILCLKAAVFLRAAFKAQPGEVRLDSRIGVGAGTVERMEPDRLRESNGEAFQRSGAVLEKLPKKGLCWAMDLGEKRALRSLQTMAFPLMDLLVQDWTQAEAAAVVGTLLGLTQDEIAAHPLAEKKDGTQPTQQAINDALKRIGWPSHWEPALQETEILLKKGLR